MTNPQPDDPVIVEFHCLCNCDDEGEREKCLSLNFKFRTRELFEMYEGDMFDNLLEPINVALGKKYGTSWYIEEFPEVNREISLNEKVNIDYVIND